MTTANLPQRVLATCIALAMTLAITWAQETRTFSVPADTRLVQPIKGSDDVLCVTLATKKDSTLHTKGQILRLNTTTGQTLWTKKINMANMRGFNSHGWLMQTASLGAYVTGIGNVELYSQDNGEQVYKVKMSPTFVDPRQEIAVGLGNNGLLAINTATGKTLWESSKAELAKYAGYWNLPQTIDSSRVTYIANNNLNVLNYHTGSIINHSIKDCLASLTPLDKKPHLLYAGDHIYLSCADEIHCFDLELNELWTHEMPTMNYREITYLNMVGDTLVYFNSGMGFITQTYNWTRTSNGFILNLDSNTGRELGKYTLPHSNAINYGPRYYIRVWGPHVKDGEGFRTLKASAQQFIAIDKEEYVAYVLDSQLNKVDSASIQHAYKEWDCGNEDYKILAYNTAKQGEAYDFWVVDKDLNVVRHCDMGTRDVFIYDDKRICILKPGSATIEQLP